MSIAGLKGNGANLETYYAIKIHFIDKMDLPSHVPELRLE